MNFISTILQYSLNMPSKKIRFTEKEEEIEMEICAQKDEEKVKKKKTNQMEIQSDFRKIIKKREGENPTDFFNHPRLL